MVSLSLVPATSCPDRYGFRLRPPDTVLDTHIWRSACQRRPKIICRWTCGGYVRNLYHEAMFLSSFSSFRVQAETAVLLLLSCSLSHPSTARWSHHRYPARPGDHSMPAQTAAASLAAVARSHAQMDARQAISSRPASMQHNTANFRTCSATLAYTIPAYSSRRIMLLSW